MSIATPTVTRLLAEAGNPRSDRGIRLTVEPILTAMTLNNIEPSDLGTRLDAALRKAKFNGFLTLAVADEIACDYLKMHPFEVWGAEYEAAAWFDMDDIEDTSAIALKVAS